MYAMRNTTVLIFMALALLSVSILPGCAKTQQETQAPPPVAAPQYQGPRFVHDASGQDYYVDSRGALHLVVRRAVEVPGSGGGIYYIEDDTRAYSIDQSERLYYRDSSGVIHFIEEVRPGRAMETVIITRQPERYAPMAPARSMESCESQWQTCMSGCNGISPRQAYDRPNCISNCEVIRSGCLGR